MLPRGGKTPSPLFRRTRPGGAIPDNEAVRVYSGSDPLRCFRGPPAPRNGHQARPHRPFASFLISPAAVCAIEVSAERLRPQRLARHRRDARTFEVLDRRRSTARRSPQRRDAEGRHDHGRLPDPGASNAATHLCDARRCTTMQASRPWRGGLCSSTTDLFFHPG